MAMYSLIVLTCL